MFDKESTLSRQERREAMLLSWKCCHVPLSTLVAGSLVLVIVLPAIFMIIAQGPANPIP